MVFDSFAYIGRLFRQKNIWLTVLAFGLGFFFQLADTTLIFLSLGTALLASWWYWRPTPPNVETRLILDTLQNCPAVLIKDHPHLVAFKSTPPRLAAAYLSPVPLIQLKRFLGQLNNSFEGVEVGFSQVKLACFLLIQHSLADYTVIPQVLQIFQAVVDMLTIQLQNTFHPAERYQILYLFGLDQYLINLTSNSTKSRKNPIDYIRTPISSLIKN